MTAQAKLTLRIDEGLINRAKRYSKRSGKSVSSIVADYFSLLDHVPAAELPKPAKIITSLVGVLKNKCLDERDYKKHLEDKYL